MKATCSLTEAALHQADPLASMLEPGASFSGSNQQSELIVPPSKTVEHCRSAECGHIGTGRICVELATLYSLLAVTGVGVTACNTTSTEEVTAATQAVWIGKPADVFFSTYGPPRSSYALDGGGKVFTWRGGEKRVKLSRDRLAPFRVSANRQTTNMISASNSSSKTSGGWTSPNTYESRTSSSSSSVNIDVDGLVNALVTGGKPKEPETRLVFCEMLVSTDANGVITNISATNDTAGAGLAFSRCAEVFKVGS